MADYPNAEKERRIPGQDLLRIVSEIFLACGMNGEDAALLADTLVHADRRGIHSHGVLRVGEYVEKLTQGGVNPRGRPRVTRDNGAGLVIDGANSMGQIGGAFAMRRVLERARETSVAFGAVGGSNHCGVLDYYTMMALSEGMIGIAGTNALPTMAPFGGIDKIVGLNPVSVAIPAGGEPPIVLDVALGATSHGKIRVFAQKNHPIPAGWALDAQGNPTTDAEAALEGLIQPIGAFKGIGLAMVVGLLSTMLSGASYGTELGNMIDGPAAGADGHFFLALKVSAFEDLARFKGRMDKAIQQFNASRRAAGVDKVHVPGALEFGIAARNDQIGIPLNRETLADVAACARRMGVSAESLG